MRFCQICGRPLQEDEHCNCRYRQSPSPAPQIAPAQKVPPVPSAAKEESAFIKTMKNVPAAFLNYWKNSEKIAETARQRRDYPLAGIFIGILFVMNAALGCSFFARMSSGTYHMGLGVLTGTFGGLYFRFHIGLVLLGALVMTLTAGILYVGARTLTQMYFTKCPVSRALGDAVIAFGMHSIPVCGLLLIGALLGLIGAWFAVLFVGLSAAYYLTVAMIAAVRESEGYRSPLLRAAILAATAAAAVGIAFYMLALVCALNYGIAVTL